MDLLESMQRMFDDYFNRYGQLVNIDTNTGIKAIFKEINDKNSIDTKYIITPACNIKQGSLINALGCQWLTTEKPTLYYKNYDKCLIRKMAYNIKWAWNSNTTIKLIPCFVDAQIFDLQNNKLFDSADGEIYVTIQANTDTNTIIEGSRFIKWGSAWKIIGINKTLEGLIKFTCKMDAFIGTDDQENETTFILITHEYKITATPLNIAINTGATQQITASVFDKGTAINNPTITYTSDNTSIATVNNTGLVTGVAQGSCNITVSYIGEDNKTYTTNIVTLVNTPANKYTITINGSNIINRQVSSKTNHPSEKYVAIINNNGVQDTSKTVKWELFNLDGVTPLTNGLVSMTVLDGTHTQVFSTPTVGKFKLKASLIDDSSIFAIMKIEVTY